MPSGSTSRFRFKAALALAALYAFCVLAPHAALALTGALAHCLTDPHAGHVQATDGGHADGKVHRHAEGGAAHRHSDAGGNVDSGNEKGGNGKIADCCGLFGITALAHEPGFALPLPPATGRAIAAVAYLLDGRRPGRINRPPIT